MPRIGVHRSVLAVLAAVVLLVVLMACSDTSSQGLTSPSPAAARTTGQPATDCVTSSALKSSLQALTAVKPLQDGLTALNTAMANVKSSLTTAAAAASVSLQPAVEGVKTAFSELETAASGLTADTAKQKAPAINTALQHVGTAASTFAATLTESCPGS